MASLRSLITIRSIIKKQRSITRSIITTNQRNPLMISMELSRLWFKNKPILSQHATPSDARRELLKIPVRLISLKEMLQLTPPLSQLAPQLSAKPALLLILVNNILLKETPPLLPSQLATPLDAKKEPLKTLEKLILPKETPLPPLSQLAILLVAKRNRRRLWRGLLDQKA